MKKSNAKKLIAVLSSAAIIAAALPTVTAVTWADDTVAESTVLGDVNNDGKVTVADAVAVLQYVANKDKFSLSEQSLDNADVYNRGDGVTARDALSIMLLDAGVLTELPESVMESASSTTAAESSVTTTATAIAPPHTTTTSTTATSIETTASSTSTEATTSSASTTATSTETTASTASTTATSTETTASSTSTTVTSTEASASSAPTTTSATSTTPSTDGLTITISGNKIETNAPEDTASVSGGVLTIKKAGKFAVTGDGTDTQIVVDVDKTAYPDSVVELDLKGMSLTNNNTAPIFVNSIGDEVQIVAKAGTVNTISDGTTHSQTYTDSDGESETVEGAIFARDDIKFKGTGTLTVNGNQDDAIVCKNDIKIYNGTINVNAQDDGIRGKDSVTIGDASKSDGSAVDYSSLKLTVKTKEGDGIKSTSTETSADKSYGVVTINGGTIDINSYLDGIQAEQEFIMNGGDLNIYTYQGSGYTGSGSTTGSQGGQGGRGGWGRPGGGGMGMDGNANKTDVSAKGIKAVGLYDEAGTTWQSKGDITINGGNITIDSSDDSIHCGGDMKIYGGVYSIATADDGFHSDHTLNIGKTAANTFDDVQIFISKCYEGVEGTVINQNSGTVYIISGDDGYNAGGGSDGSGNQPGFPGNPWGQGATASSSTKIEMNINGGFVCVNSANGDHDAFDSNGNINLNGGYICANGQEPLDCGDGGGYSINYNGASVITMTAGNTNLATRYSFVDDSGKVIVSFLSANGSAGMNCTSCTAQSGGTLSGGEQLLAQSDKYAVTVGGTLSGGTKITAGTSSGGGFGRF